MLKLRYDRDASATWPLQPDGRHWQSIGKPLIRDCDRWAILTRVPGASSSQPKASAVPAYPDTVAPIPTYQRPAGPPRAVHSFEPDGRHWEPSDSLDVWTTEAITVLACRVAHRADSADPGHGSIEALVLVSRPQLHGGVITPPPVAAGSTGPSSTRNVGSATDGGWSPLSRIKPWRCLSGSELHT